MANTLYQARELRGMLIKDDKIRTVVVPGTGVRTGFLPTRAHPKETFPVLDKPVISSLLNEGFEND